MRLKIQMPTSAKAQLAAELEQQQATTETRDFVGSQASTDGLHVHPASGGLGREGKEPDSAPADASTLTQQPPLLPIAC